MEILIRAAAIAIAAAVLGLVIRKHNPDMALMMTLAAGTAVLIGTTALLTPLLSFINELAGEAGFSSALLAPVLKSLGIAIVGKTVSDVCKDAGQTALSSSVEFCATLAALVCAVPLMRTVLQMLRELM
jgi:stage III sporulation protein AD